MKKLLITGTLLAGLFFSQAQAQTIAPRAMVHDIHQDFWSTFSTAGMRGVSDKVSNCYLTPSSYKWGVRGCILEDLAARNMDKAFRAILVSQGHNDPGPPTQFMADRAFNMRAEIYFKQEFPASAAFSRFYAAAVRCVADESCKI